MGFSKKVSARSRFGHQKTSMASLIRNTSKCGKQSGEGEGGKEKWQGLRRKVVVQIVEKDRPTPSLESTKPQLTGPMLAPSIPEEN